MPPQCSAPEVVEPELCTSALAPLPPALVQRIFTSLPADSRGRAACVCLAWRAALADPALWTRLDFSGIAWRRVPDVLRGASARACGQLCELDVSGSGSFTLLEPAALVAVVAANASSLRELRVDKLYSALFEGEERQLFSLRCNAKTLDALARAAPHLQVLDAHARCKWEDAPRLIRAEPPLTSLRLHTLEVDLAEDGELALLGSSVWPRLQPRWRTPRCSRRCRMWRSRTLTSSGWSFSTLW